MTGASAAQHRLRHGALPGLIACLAGCAGEQSTFSTFGAEAESTRLLLVSMTVAAAVITLAMGWIAVHAVRAPKRLDDKAGERFILWAGAIGPTALLTLLLLLALPTMRNLPSRPNDLRVAVAGEQFWWRVRYAPNGAMPIETANEIRVPVGRAVVFTLTSPDILHSFWVPGLAGKVDMIPGRTNSLTVRATKAGIYRGACAEFCGLSHARMAFDVVAMEPEAFDRWLVFAALPAADVTGRGRDLFAANGCGGCHAVRGHGADGTIGPDLTHLGARRSIAAASRPLTTAELASFIHDPSALKPGVRMPGFDTLSEADLQAMSVYLAALE